MSQSINPGFNSLISKFTVDGNNLVSTFLDSYAKSFVKGFASSKIAATALSSTLLAEIEIPIAAISAFISTAGEFFNGSDPQKEYLPGTVALYENGYWPITPEEEAMMAMNQVDVSFEPLSQVKRYDICLIKRRLEDDRYVIYDLASKDTKEVSYMKLRPEQNKEISKYDIIKKLRDQIVSFTPKTNSIEFKIGQYVYARGLEGQTDFEGTIKNITKDVILVTVGREPAPRVVIKSNWLKLLSKSEILNMKSFQEGRSDFQVNSLCLYQDGPNVRPCIVIQLKPVCLIRPFHENASFEIDPKLLVKASSSYKTKLYNTKGFRQFIEMVKETPRDYTDRMHYITKSNAENGFLDTRQKKESEVKYFAESEIIPASIETRQYGGFKDRVADSSSPRHYKDGGSPTMVFRTSQNSGRPEPEMVLSMRDDDFEAGSSDIGAYTTGGALFGRETVGPIKIKTTTVTTENGYVPLIIGAVVVIGGILLFK